MSDYVRWFSPGGTYFFTVVTERRRPLFASEPARAMLGDVIRNVAADAPFDTVAITLLPDHLHVIWTLPDGDADFSERWRRIKRDFTVRHLASGGVEMPRSASRVEHRNRGVWQRRFYEHLIRDADDFRRHVDYIHINAVKHDLVRCPHEWPHSSFRRWVDRGDLRDDWCCVCDDQKPNRPDFGWAAVAME
jgi:putative transposase